MMANNQAIVFTADTSATRRRPPFGMTGLNGAIDIDEVKKGVGAIFNTKRQNSAGG